MKRPNFFVIGQMRGGSTFLHSLLKTHSQVYLPPVIKESRFFVFDLADADRATKIARPRPVTMQDYLSLYADANDRHSAIGDVSPQYIASEVAHKQIYEFAPRARIICTLRNPADRVYSLYNLAQQQKRTSSSFLDDFRGDVDSRLVQRGYMHANFKRYLTTFSRQQLLVFRFQSLVRNLEVTKAKVCDHLAIEVGDFLDFPKPAKNASGIAKFPFMHRAYSRLRMSKTMQKMIPSAVKRGASHVWHSSLSKPQRMSSEEHAELLQFYREDSLRLQDLLDIDLNDWIPK